MNMFERTHSFVPGHFIRHHTFNYYFLLINAKMQKQCRTLEKHDLNPISLNVMRTHCSRQENTMEL